MSTKYHVFSPITGTSHSVDTEEEALALRAEWIEAYLAEIAPSFSIMKEEIDQDGNSVMVPVELQ